MGLKMDYEKIYSILHEKKMSVMDASALCGRSKTWLSAAKHNDSALTEPLANLLARTLGVELEDIMWVDKVEPVSATYDELKNAIDILISKVEELTEIVGIQQDDILSILAGTNKVASAVAIANAMLQANGRCKETRFRDACSRRGINGEEIKRALEDVGAHYETIGKGSAAVRWIVKERLGV